MEVEDAFITEEQTQGGLPSYDMAFPMRYVLARLWSKSGKPRK